MSRLFIVFLVASAVSTMSSCTSVFFQPTRDHVLTPEQFGVVYEDVYFTSVDNHQLHGWWFSAEQAPKAIVLFIHGNAQNISTHASGIHWLTKHGYDVFIFDYRGYGQSQGYPYLEGVISDTRQAISYVNERKAQNQKLFIVGQSLGASIGIVALSDAVANIAGAIFISPFSDYRAVTRDVLSQIWWTWPLQWPLSMMINNDYRPLDYVSKVSPVPFLLMYSKEDEVIDSYHVKKLYSNAFEPKYIEEVTGTHNSILGIQENRDMIIRYLGYWSE